MKNNKFTVLAMACSAMVVSAFLGINANKSAVGDITLAELINTPDASACVEAPWWVDSSEIGRCSLNDRCYANPAWSDVQCYLGH